MTGCLNFLGLLKTLAKVLNTMKINLGKGLTVKFFSLK